MTFIPFLAVQWFKDYFYPPLIALISNYRGNYVKPSCAVNKDTSPPSPHRIIKNLPALRWRRACGASTSNHFLADLLNCVLIKVSGKSLARRDNPAIKLRWQICVVCSSVGEYLLTTTMNFGFRYGWLALSCSCPRSGQIVGGGEVTSDVFCCWTRSRITRMKMGHFRIAATSNDGMGNDYGKNENYHVLEILEMASKGAATTTN